MAYELLTSAILLLHVSVRSSRMTEIVAVNLYCITVTWWEEQARLIIF